MTFKLKDLAAFGIIFMIAISCKDAGTNPTIPDDSNYFPGTEGSNFKYSIVQIDSSGNQQSGTRNVYFNGDTLLILASPVSYRIQIDTLNLFSSSIRKSFFRKTTGGVYYFVDTSLVSQLIPDTLKEYVTLQQETRILFFPLVNSYWPVYSVLVTLPNNIQFKPVELSATYISTENISLPLVSGTISAEAVKIKYDLKIIEDITTPARNYSALGWFTDEIGLVKLEGNGLILNALISGEINPDDSTSTFTQELIDYHIE